MTDTERALMAGVLAAPDDDTPRLILADWLEENAGWMKCPVCDNESGYRVYCVQCEGSGRAGWASDGRRERAEFIRVQLELARGWRSPPGNGSEDHRLYDALRWRERGLLTWDNADRWFCGTDFKLSNVTHDAKLKVYAADAPENALNSLDLTVRRGFVEAITCPVAVLFGGPCERCDTLDYMPMEDGGGGRVCSACKGETRTPGIAAELFATELFRSQPVKRVTVMDAEILIHEVHDGFLFREGLPLDLEAEVMRLHQQQVGDRFAAWPDRAGIIAALSAAIVSWGRSLAKLPTTCAS